MSAISGSNDGAIRANPIRPLIGFITSSSLLPRTYQHQSTKQAYLLPRGKSITASVPSYHLPKRVATVSG